MSRFFDKKIILVLCILGLAAFIRLYNFENRLIFGPEQGMSLIVSGDYIKDKFSLLGQEYFRVTSEGHILFASALFSYSLVPLQLLFNFNPYPITVYFALLNIFTGLVLFLVIKKIFNFPIAFISLILFLFNETMVYHSMFIWITNYTPLIGILNGFVLWKFIKEKSIKWIFLVGLLSGVGFGLQYFYLVTAFVFFIVAIFFAKSRAKTALVFLLGAIIGNLPMVLFDLRHQFYHLDSFWKYTVDTYKYPAQSSLTYYHYLHLWPYMILVLSLVCYYIYRKNKVLAIGLVLIYCLINITGEKISFTYSVGMRQGMNLRTWEEAAALIAKDNPPKKFNIASIIDFNNRAHPLRYLLKFKHGFTAMGVEEYKNPDVLYVFADTGHKLHQALAWEVQVYEPFDIKTVAGMGQFTIYKLTKK